MTIYIADNAMFMSIYAKIDIDKTGAFEYETTFFAGKDAKQGIKVPPTWRINFSASPSGLRADPGLHLFRTRVLVVGTPGSQAALKAVFDKRKACLDEKRSRFNMFCTCFRTIPVFIVQLIHRMLSFYTMIVMIDE